MLNSEIAAIGEFLHGKEWQSPLARDLQVNNRTMRYWLAGTYQPRGGVVDDLVTLAACRLIEKKALESAANGRWGGKEVVFKADAATWSAVTDALIKKRAAEILKDMGLSADVI